MLSLVLQISAVVAKSVLTLAIAVRLHRLDLALEGVVDALTLIVGMVKTFWACNLLHGHIGAQRHTLMNVAS